LFFQQNNTAVDEDWINKLLILLWPHIGNVVKNMLLNNVGIVRVFI